MIKSDYRMGSLVSSKPTEGSVAGLVSLLVLALASPAVANDGGGNSADYNDGHRGRKHTALTATGWPPEVTIDPATGVISGVVDRKAITDVKMTYDAQISIKDINEALGRFSIKIILPNTGPVAAEDRAIVSPGISSVISVLENDVDGDGDELAIFWAKPAQSNAAAGQTLSNTGRIASSQIVTARISLASANVSNPPPLSVTTASGVHSDGLSSTNPKSIPGALVAYTIAVTNPGAIRLSNCARARNRRIHAAAARS